MLTVEDYEEGATARLPKNLADYLKHGAGKDLTLSRNYEYLNKVRVIPRYLRDLSNLTSATTILNTTHDMPIGIAPSGLHKRWNSLGEIATVRGMSKTKQ
jgi:isopentenyl diphosphate isomerase/L-lactate dehydrogenase-like FMN-dependent dehydrogenase